MAEDRQSRIDALLASAFDMTTDLLLLVRIDSDGEYRIERANRAYAEACQAPGVQVGAPDLVGMTLVQVVNNLRGFSADLTALTLESFRHAETTREVHLYDETMVQKDGRRYVAESAVLPLIDDDGVCRHLLAQSRAVSESKLAEERRRHNEALLAALFDHSLQEQLVARMDEGQASIVAANRRLVDTARERGLEVSREWFIGKAIADLGARLQLSPEAIEARCAAIERAAARGQVERFVESSQGPDGERHADVSVVPITGGDGGCRYVLWTAHDITEAKRAAEALSESEERRRLSMRAAKQGFFDIDLRARKVVVSAEYATMLGYDSESFEESAEGLLGRTHPDDRWRVQAVMNHVVKGAQNEYAFDLRLRTADGKWKWTRARGEIVAHDAGGSPTRMVGTLTDIDEHKRADLEQRRTEEQMRNVQKLESLGVLAGGIAHDFNNLLMSVLGNADLALDVMTHTHPACELVGEIKKASLNAAELCRQMMTYAGKGRFVLDTIDLSELVREMGQILHVSVGKNASLRYELAEGLPQVQADASQLRQVVMNLVTNASDAIGEESGIISVCTGVNDCDHDYLKGLYLGGDLSNGEYVYVEVADTGMGMDDETRERIFDPFFTTKFVGRGLGMAATLGIVRGHKGGIKLYTEPGRGTSLKVLFPAVRAMAAEADATTSPAPSPWQGIGTILLVDDEEIVRQVASRMLERLGFAAVEAVDGRDAVEKYRAEPDRFTCVLLDLTMPRMNGIEAYRELRRIRSDVCVVLSSGYNERETTQQVAGKGNVGFIQKPYTIARLREALQSALD